MDKKVRHLRLKEFYESTFLNACIIGISLSLQCALFNYGSNAPMMSCGIFALAFIVYTIWYWAGKRKDISTNQFLSGISGTYLFYCLIVGMLDNPSDYWFYFAIASAIAILLVFLLRLDRKG